MTKLSDFGNFKYKTVVKMEEVEGKEITIDKVSFSNGEFGRMAIMRVTLEDGELCTIMTSSDLITSALEEAAKENVLPLQVTFVKDGRMWTVK